MTCIIVVMLSIGALDIFHDSNISLLLNHKLSCGVSVPVSVHMTPHKWGRAFHFPVSY